ncbi:MAG: amidase [Chloroflexi bacterium]|nr:amidase [Chloroflexota bacterium]
MSKMELAFAPAWLLADLIAAKKLSPVELTERFLKRIEELNPTLNAYLTVTGDEAIAVASRAEEALVKGKELGPLHGVPISIKDLELTKGVRTTLGSLVFQEYVPDMDSIIVERVQRAGAIVLGKTNTSELGLSGTTENYLGDACRNPWNREYTAGGSSGGAGAAVAAGLCPLATGSDGGGSIRIPSSFCGVYGIKPSQGRVPRYGGVSRPAPGHFSQSGPMARTVKDAAILLQVLAGPDHRDVTCMKETPPDFVAVLSHEVRGLKIGWSRDLGYAVVDPEVVKVTEDSARAFEEMGCGVEEVDVALEEPFEAFWTLFSTNAYTSYGHLLESSDALLTDYVKYTLEYGRDVKGSSYARAIWYRDQLQGKMERLMGRYDLLLTSTMAVPAFPIGHRPQRIGGREVDPFWGFVAFTFPFNMTGQPAASIPCGFSRGGLPIGLQIVGRRGDEATVLRASAAFEQSRPWADKRPPIA